MNNMFLLLSNEYIFNLNKFPMLFLEKLHTRMTWNIRLKRGLNSVYEFGKQQEILILKHWDLLSDWASGSNLSKKLHNVVRYEKILIKNKSYFKKGLDLIFFHKFFQQYSSLTTFFQNCDQCFPKSII
jgi:hypothetical protein